MSRYQKHWWYVERPFPWLLIAIVSVPILLCIAAVVLGIVLL